jgi:hypothetical protein
MKTYDEAHQICKDMERDEYRALRQCAAAKLEQEMFGTDEGIGTSDVSIRAIEMIQYEEWPKSVEGISLQSLVTIHAAGIAGLLPERTPAEIAAEMNEPPAAACVKRPIKVEHLEPVQTMDVGEKIV